MKHPKVLKTVFLTILLSLPLLVGCNKKKSEKTTKKGGTNTVTTKGSSHTHEFGEWKIIQSSTCNEHGYKKRACACGEYEIEELPFTSHTFEHDKCVDCGYEQLSEGFYIEYVSYEYSLDEREPEYIIRGYQGTSKEVRIPKYYDDGINGFHKLTIGKDPSSVNVLNNTSIEKIYIGEEYEIIPAKFLSGITNLKEVVLPKNCATISDAAFKDCTSLETVAFNEGLMYIKSNAFQNCNIKKLRCPSTLEYILINSFSGNTNLTEVTLNEGLEIIDSNAFADTAISTLVLPRSLESFGYQERMNSLTSISISGVSQFFKVENNCLIDIANNSVVKGFANSTIPSTVEIIGAYAFSNLDFTGIDEFVIPSSVTTILFDAFYGSKFNSLVLPELEEINDEAFKGIEFGEDYIFVIPQTVLTIGKNAFDRAAFKQLIIPESVEEVGSSILNKSTAESVKIYESTLDSPYCSSNWSAGFEGEIIEVSGE
ncbi:MAG: leucine-rich repeat domain-containing protein [Acholeplasmatales bacterium]|nr:leucine-rich repeat domain-containing protein [Acholeplasmatales bacterium]